jgi:hypothetical protein
MVFGTSLLVLLLVSLASGVRVNEIMADPARCPDTDCEYIEIYTDSPINLTNWIINTTNQDTDFSFYLEDYLIITANKEKFISNFSVDEEKIIEWAGISLLNNGESVFLFDNSSVLIDDFTYSFSNSGISWQFCSDSWMENEPTPGSENNCTTPQNNSTPPQTASIDLELDWKEEEIVNGNEFEIDVDAYNLESKDYDLRVYITFRRNDTLISEIYHEDDERWRSGNNYVTEVFSGPGNKSETFSLRIKEEHEYFYGDIKIVTKIRETDTRSVKHSVTAHGELLEEEPVDDDDDDDNTDDVDDEDNDENPVVTNGIIRLGEREEDEKQEGVIYESGSEKVKKYAIYGLNLILIVILVLLARKKI